LAVKFNKTRNPLREAVTYGQNSVANGWELIAYGIGGDMAGAGLKKIGGLVSKVPGLGWVGGKTMGMVGALTSAASGMLVSIGTIFVVFGMLLGYWLPISPFVRFFFAALTWIIGLFEAIVAVPLWALAHINPTGEGLPGDGARRGYFLIFNIFMRPTLMTLGLIAGYIMFVLCVAFLNTMFIFAAKGATTLGGGHMPAFAKMVYSIVYCALVYALGNNCFKSIGMFSDHALTWVGGGGDAHKERMGNHQLIQRMAGFLGAQMMMQTVKQHAGAPKRGIEAAGKARDAKQKEKQATFKNRVQNAAMEHSAGQDGNQRNLSTTGHNDRTEAQLADQANAIPALPRPGAGGAAGNAGTAAQQASAEPSLSRQRALGSRRFRTRGPSSKDSESSSEDEA
jgi:hypothetical protein